MKKFVLFAFFAVFYAAFSACSNPALEDLSASSEAALERAPMFSASASLITPRSDVSAIALADGRILVAGGRRDYGSYSGPLVQSEIYSARNGAKATGSMREARFGHALTLLSDGRVLATGGSYQDSRCRYFAPPERATAEIYNPRTGRWTATGTMKFPRVGHDAASLRDGRVLVVGGRAEAEIWSPRTGTFRVVGSLAFARHDVKLVPLLDGRVLVLGRPDTDDPEAKLTAEIFYPETGTFKLTLPANVERAWGFSATRLADGRVLVAGGDADTGKPGSVEIYDPVTGEWTFVGRLSTDRVRHGAALLRDGSVLVAGGEGIANRDDDPAAWFTAVLSSCDRIYPDSGEIVAEGELSAPRVGHGFFFVPDSRFGTVYALGGFDSNGSSSSVDILTWR